MNKFTNSNFTINSGSKNKIFNKYEYFNYQLTGYLNTTELFKTMQVAQPSLSMDLINKLNNQKSKYLSNGGTPRLGQGGLTSDSINFNAHINDNNGNEHDRSLITGYGKVDKLGFDLIENDVLNDALVSKYEHDINFESSDEFKIEKDFTITLGLCNGFEIDEGELSLLKDKVCFDLKNNYVDINDYCAFYISLENILHEVMNFID